MLLSSSLPELFLFLYPEPKNHKNKWTRRENSHVVRRVEHSRLFLDPQSLQIVRKLQQQQQHNIEFNIRQSL